MRKYLFCILSLLLIFNLLTYDVNGEMNLDARSVILIEQKTGKVLYEDNADERLPPASVTKIMTILLVMEAIDNARINLTDSVCVSENAASMGGSQVYLEVGETMSVDEMLKCVVVASANDAAVALAEHVSGSEEEFVSEMNQRAAELGMVNTNFENTNGLDDTTENHYTSARDIAIMSRELLNHEKIFDYTTIWMDSVRNGAFTLTNTNRLIRFYKGANGLKTGSTSKAKFCLSASAKRNEMQLIAVVMASSTRDSRNEAAVKLLDYGFAGFECVSYAGENIQDVKVVGGVREFVPVVSGEFNDVLKKGESERIQKVYEIPQNINAPIKKGDVVGRVLYKLDGEIIGQCEVYADEEVKRVDFFYQIQKILNNFLLY